MFVLDFRPLIMNLRLLTVLRTMKYMAQRQRDETRRPRAVDTTVDAPKPLSTAAICLRIYESFLQAIGFLRASIHVD